MILPTTFVSSLGDQPLISKNFTIPSIPQFFAIAIGWGLIIGAVIVFGCIVITGFQLATAGNDSGKTKNARDQITNCLFGFGVLSSAWAISLIVQAFLGIDQFQKPGEIYVPPNNQICRGAGAYCGDGGGCCSAGGLTCDSQWQMCITPMGTCGGCPAGNRQLCSPYDPSWAILMGLGTITIGTGSCPDYNGNPQYCYCTPATGSIAPPTPTGVTLASTPDHFYYFNNASVPVIDVSGTTATLTFTNPITQTSSTVTLSDFGAGNDQWVEQASGCGGSMYYDGDFTTGIINNTGNPEIRTPTFFALSAWIKPEPFLASNHTISYIISNNRISLTLNFNGDSGLIDLLGAEYASVTTRYDVGIAIPQNIWTHAALTYNQITNISTIYINGQIVDTRNMSLSTDTDPTSWPITIAMDPNNTAAFLRNSYKGFIDEVVAYADDTQPFTPELVSSLYNSCNANAGPQADPPTVPVLPQPTPTPTATPIP